MAYDDIPKLLKDFLYYLDVVNAKSQKTIYEYYLDLRLFLKYFKKKRFDIDKDISFVIEDIFYIPKVGCQQAVVTAMVRPFYSQSATREWWRALFES